MIVLAISAIIFFSGVAVGLTVNPLVGFIMGVTGAALPYLYEPVKSLFK